MRFRFISMRWIESRSLNHLVRFLVNIFINEISFISLETRGHHKDGKDIKRHNEVGALLLLASRLMRFNKLMQLMNSQNE